ncbi:MAG: ATP-binding protein [Ignavibacteriae bacterium]|nr:ATP-binding protein [Ignavibacteriota bacterium]
MEIENPFLITGYVSPEYFCDREEEIKLLTSRIADSTHTALFSPRRLGKTALLQQLLYNLKKEKIKFIYFDLMSTNSIEDFVYHFAKSFFNQSVSISRKYFNKLSQLLKGFMPTIVADPGTGSINIELKLTKVDEVYNDLGKIFDYIKNSDEKYFIALDEFQQILTYPDKNFEGFLRSHIQFINNASFVFSGSKHHLLLSLFGEYSRPLWQTSTFMELKTIDWNKYSIFIESKFQKKGRQISSDALDFIKDSTRGITFFVQLFCNNLYKDSAKNINLSTAEKVLEQIVGERESYCINYIELLTKKQLQVLKAIAYEDGIEKPLSIEFIGKYKLGATSTVKSVLDVLLAKDAIQQYQGKYYLSDVLLGIWLKNYFR